MRFWMFYTSTTFEGAIASRTCIAQCVGTDLKMNHI